MTTGPACWPASRRCAKALTGLGAAIDTASSSGKFSFTEFAALPEFTALAEFERDLIVERTRAGLVSARAQVGRPYTMTTAKLRRAQAGMGQPETHVSALCRELGVTRQALYRYVGQTGELRRYPLLPAPSPAAASPRTAGWRPEFRAADR